MKKILYGLLLATLLSIVMFGNIGQLEASGTIYIRPDGSVDPPTAPIQRNGALYAFINEIKDSIVVERDNIVINGSGRTLEGMGGEEGISLHTRKNVVITNMAIKVFEVGIHFEECSNCTVSEVDIMVTMRYGIELSGNSMYTSLSENNITANKKTAIFLYNCSDNVISKNHIDSLDSGDTRGIWINSGNNNVLSENNVTRTSLSGIDVYGSNNTLFGNIVENTTSSGIYISGSINNLSDNKISSSGLGISLTGTSNTLSSNNVSNMTYSGIETFRAISNVLSNNTITDCGLYSNGHGIFLDFLSSSNEISENVIMYIHGDGIHLDSSSYNRLYGNIVMHCISYCINLWGSAIHGSCINNTLTGNTVAYSDYDGISLLSSPNSTISGNTIENNNRGISVHGVSCTIYNNTITDNSESGIRFSFSSSSVLSRNNIANNQYGILIPEGSASKDNFIYHNCFVNNSVQVFEPESNVNYWDNGSMSGGNYWSDYEGEDQDGDGFGDTLTPHYKDRYPLVVPPNPLPLFHGETRYYCFIAGNMTVARFNADLNKIMNFKTFGQGYVNLTIPREYSDGFFKVFINDTQTPCMSTCNGTYTTIYFETRTSGSNNVKIEAQMKFLGDIDGNGAVNIIDISIVAKHFGLKLNP